MVSGPNRFVGRGRIPPRSLPRAALRLRPSLRDHPAARGLADLLSCVAIDVYDKPRKRTLGPIGGVILVAIIGAVVLAIILRGNPPKPGIGPIRAYYRSAAGGSVPSTVVNRL